jgi:hypothetical protein
MGRASETHHGSDGHDGFRSRSAYPAPLSRRPRAIAGERLDQRRASCEIGLRGEAVRGCRRRLGQLFRRVDFDERHHPVVLVQHGGADIDEEIEALSSGRVNIQFLQCGQ